jgi:hypothetical protein
MFFSRRRNNEVSPFAGDNNDVAPRFETATALCLAGDRKRGEVE